MMMNKNNNQHNSSSDEDEQYFSDYLQGNSSLSNLYQQTAAPEPSSALDDTILSAANRHIESKKTPHWWTQPASWAASAAIFSLLGLLTLNTWQLEKAETDSSLAMPEPGSKATVAADIQFQSMTEQKQRIQKKSQQDTRKLIYKQTAAPTSIPKSEIQFMPGKPMAAKVMSQAEQDKQNPVHYLQQVKHLITENKLDEARQELQKLQTKYPNYPVDPVILQHLSP